MAHNVKFNFEELRAQLSLALNLEIKIEPTLYEEVCIPVAALVVSITNSTRYVYINLLAAEDEGYSPIYTLLHEVSHAIGYDTKDLIPPTDYATYSLEECIAEHSAYIVYKALGFEITQAEADRYDSYITSWLASAKSYEYKVRGETRASMILNALGIAHNSREAA